MPADIKVAIAEAAVRLLMEKHMRKLTVKDIVEECQISRQAFYYHFADIPELFRWMLEQYGQRVMREIREQADAEQGLHHFFVVAIHAMPLVRRGMATNYGAELEQLLNTTVLSFFEQAVEADDLYPTCTRAEVKILMRYHAQAVLGLLRGWTDEDTRNLDQIVHLIYLTLVGKLSPLG